MRRSSSSFVVRAAVAALLSTTAVNAVAAQPSIAPPARFTDPDRVAKLRAALPQVDSVMRAFATNRFCDQIT